MNPRRLYRSRRDRAIAGVAGGLAEYLEVDPTLVRILWILSIFFGGFTILLYIVMALVVPLNPHEGPYAPSGPQGPAGPYGSGGGPGAPGGTSNASWSFPAPAGASYGSGQHAPGGYPATGWAATEPSTPSWGADYAAGWRAREAADRTGRTGRGALAVGTILVVFGGISLIGVIAPGWPGAAVFWPALVVALGAALLVGSLRGPNGATATQPAGPAPAPATAEASVPAAAEPITPEPAAEPSTPAAPVAIEQPATPTPSNDPDLDETRTVPLVDDDPS